MTVNPPDISQRLLIQSRTSHPRASGTEEHVGAWAQSLEKFWTLCFSATRSSLVVASDPRLESDCSSVDMTMTLHSGSHPVCIRSPPVTTYSPYSPQSQPPLQPALPPRRENWPASGSSQLPPVELQNTRQASSNIQLHCFSALGRDRSICLF